MKNDDYGFRPRQQTIACHNQLPTIKNSHHPEPFFDWQAFALRAYALPDAAIGKANTPHPSHIYLHIRSNSLNYRLPE
ncbi:MAG: hypothetical protein IJM59_11775 [Proteobacteria bacterium]|nr:hypothetical protein [Pseudomonadota bacterium]